MRIDYYLRADSAAMFGKLGRELEQALAAYAAVPLEPAGMHEEVLHAAAEAVWRYFVVREACGLNDHTPIVETYQVPPEVLARVGTPRQTNS